MVSGVTSGAALGGARRFGGDRGCSRGHARRLRCLAGLVAALAGSAGCGGGAPSAQKQLETPEAAPSVGPVDVLLAGCETDVTRWTPVSANGLAAAESGAGTTTVVFVNDSNNSVCGWMTLADALVRDHRRVAVFAYDAADPDDEAQAVRDSQAVADASRGGGRYALVGASVGARAVIVAAAAHPPGLATIVALSAERSVDGYPDLLPSAREVSTPALYVGAADDVYTQGARQQRQLHEAMRGHPNLLLQRAGSAHGSELLDLDGPDGRAVQQRVRTFLDEQLGTS